MTPRDPFPHWTVHYMRDTSAASHPELIGGEFALRPRRPVVWSAEDVATYTRWWRYRLAGTAVAVALIALAPAFTRGSASVPEAKVEHAGPAAVCAEWDDVAKAALIATIRDGQDRDLRQAEDTLVQLRRARRNCQMGWLKTACLDFNAIAQGKARFQLAGAQAPIACDAPGSGDHRQITGAVERK